MTPGQSPLPRVPLTIPVAVVPLVGGVLTVQLPLEIKVQVLVLYSTQASTRICVCGSTVKLRAVCGLACWNVTVIRPTLRFVVAVRPVGDAAAVMDIARVQAKISKGSPWAGDRGLFIVILLSECVTRGLFFQALKQGKAVHPLNLPEHCIGNFHLHPFASRRSPVYTQPPLFDPAKLHFFGGAALSSVGSTFHTSLKISQSHVFFRLHRHLSFRPPHVWQPDRKSTRLNSSHR